MKSKEREVKTKIPTVGENDKKPGAIQGILAKIMDSVADDEKGTPNVKKKKQQARDEIVMFLLNDALEDEEKGSQYNIEEARMFSVGIREEIDKYAKRIARKDKQIRFSPALFRVAMKIWVRSPAAYEDMRKSGWIMSLPSQQRLRDLRHGG
jgi:poly-D-alanine transfer protein DltD